MGALGAHGIELVADVRRFPGSRRLPQFAQDALARTLAGRDMLYEWLPELGGRRRSRADVEPHPGWRTDGWRHAAFRAYAAHVATEEFASGLASLTDAAYGLRTAIMCAEVLWWRCHRRLIADVLVATGYPVVHIRDATHFEPHRLAAPARIVAGQLSYASSGTSITRGAT